MPYTAKQKKTARAIAHGWVPPKGSAVENFSKKFAKDVMKYEKGKKK